MNTPCDVVWRHASDSANACQPLLYEIFGEPASKANSRRVVKFGGMSRLIKSHKALTYTDVFNSQVDRERATPLNGDVAMEIHIFYASRRPDLDESLILDLLQGVAYLNDRQVKQRHTYWHLDQQQPRALIKVWGIESVEPKKRPRTRRGQSL